MLARRSWNLNLTKRSNAKKTSGTTVQERLIVDQADRWRSRSASQFWNGIALYNLSLLTYLRTYNSLTLALTHSPTYFIIYLFIYFSSFIQFLINRIITVLLHGNIYDDVMPAWVHPAIKKLLGVRALAYRRSQMCYRYRYPCTPQFLLIGHWGQMH